MNVAMWRKALRVIPHVSKEEWGQLDVVSKWLISTRAAVLIMTFLSGAIAGILAIQSGNFNFWYWLLVTVGLIMAHATNNLLNDYTAYTRGVDQGRSLTIGNVGIIILIHFFGKGAAMYPEIVMDHFKNPRNVGEITDADGIGEVGNPVCGDMRNVYIKVEGDRIEYIKFKTFGCGAAIAVSSMITELAKGKTLDQAMKITNNDVAKALGGLPKNKLPCSNLGADALHSAIKNLLDRKSGKIPDLVKDREEHVKGKGGEGCYCPYCQKEAAEEAPFCLFCGAKIPHEHDH